MVWVLPPIEIGVEPPVLVAIVFTSGTIVGTETDGSDGFGILTGAPLLLLDGVAGQSLVLALTELA